MTPIEYTKYLWENQTAEIKDLKASLELISNSYIRLRELIPGAFNTPKEPSCKQVYYTTEAALEKFIKDHIHD